MRRKNYPTMKEKQDRIKDMTPVILTADTLMQLVERVVNLENRLEAEIKSRNKEHGELYEMVCEYLPIWENGTVMLKTAPDEEMTERKVRLPVGVAETIQ